jgi:hypothetical protein
VKSITLINGAEDSPGLRKPRQHFNAQHLILIALRRLSRYTNRVKFLTRQEQLVLAVVLGLLLTGLCVKYYRSGHPAQIATIQQAK